MAASADRKLELIGDVREFMEPASTAQKEARHKVWLAERNGIGAMLDADEASALWSSVLKDSMALLHAVDELARTRKELNAARETLNALQDVLEGVK
jgi:hypothetical protein